MGRSIFLAAILTLLGGMAFAEHALAPDAAPVAKEDKATAAAPTVEPTPTPQAAQEQAQAATPTTPTPPAPQVVVQPAPPVVVKPAAADVNVDVKPASPDVNVTFPSELDLYMVPAATREVCTTRDWGAGEVETDCRVRPIPIRRADPKLRGLCVTRYGQRVCY